MKDYIEERAIGIANYIIESNATVRQTAKARLNKNLCIAIKTYIASKIDGTPQEFPENYACWVPIKKLIAEEKRLATTHLLDDDLIKYMRDEKVNMIFTCDSNHNVINMEIR